MADADEKLDAYPHTVLHFAGPPAFDVDLRRALDAEDRARLAALGLGDQFAVLTVENPEGENAEDAGSAGEARRRTHANARRTRTLLDTLAEARLPHARVDGTAPDGGYREHCVAVPGPLAEARALATTAAQLALFWYDGGAFWLVPALPHAPPTRLPAVAGDAP